MHMPYVCRKGACDLLVTIPMPFVLLQTAQLLSMPPVQDFLRAGQVLCIAVDQSGEEEQVVLPEAHTLTQLPLVRP